MSRIVSFAAVASLAMTVSVAQADPVQWAVSAGGNGHWYEVVVAPQGVTWDEAAAASTARGGYLATLTSDSENAFVFALADRADAWQALAGSAFGEMRGPWLGGLQPPGSPEPYGGWQWVNGEGPFVYTNWLLANNLGGNEDVINFFGLWGQRSAQWNDDSRAVSNIAYVVEWTTQPVPEPAAAAMLLAGLAFVARAARGRRGAATQAG
ncbi:MAG: PEP-CTERM sorting domain-containing protein [Betaproteobacteria bacterium]|jgi:hypothetical protein